MEKKKEKKNRGRTLLIKIFGRTSTIWRFVVYDKKEIYRWNGPGSWVVRNYGLMSHGKYEISPRKVFRVGRDTKSRMYDMLSFSRLDQQYQIRNWASTPIWRFLLVIAGAFLCFVNIIYSLSYPNENIGGEGSIPIKLYCIFYRVLWYYY